MYFEGELPTVAYGNNCNGNNGWNDWSWIIGLALVGGLFGNGGFGFGGGNRGGYGYGCGTPATVQDVASGFSTSEIMSDLNAIINAQTQGFAGLNASIANATSTLGYNMLQGFNGVDNAVCTLGYNTQANFNAIGTQVADCCCRIERGLDNIRFENARSTCDIIRANQDNTRQILDFLTGEKIASLQAENSGLKAQISNDRQSAYIIDALAPKCPQPAYVVPNPNCCYNYGVYPTGGCGATIQ